MDALVEPRKRGVDAEGADCDPEAVGAEGLEEPACNAPPHRKDNLKHRPPKTKKEKSWYASKVYKTPTYVCSK